MNACPCGHPLSVAVAEKVGDEVGPAVPHEVERAKAKGHCTSCECHDSQGRVIYDVADREDTP